MAKDLRPLGKTWGHSGPPDLHGLLQNQFQKHLITVLLIIWVNQQQGIELLGKAPVLFAITRARNDHQIVSSNILGLNLPV